MLRGLFLMALSTLFTACHGGASRSLDAAAGPGAGVGDTSPAGAGGGASQSGEPGSAAGGGGGTNPLGALGTDDRTIDQASGAALLELARQVGVARGRAVCACTLPQPLPADALEECAEVESSCPALFDPMQARCILEQSRAVVGFDAYLRCRTKNVRANGRAYADCVGGTANPSATGTVTCDATPPPEAAELLTGGACARAFYCQDGTSTLTGRCDSKVDCPDGADERGCE